MPPFHVSTPLADELSSYLNLETRRMGVISSNVANMDTPGYKTQDFDFARAFQNASSGSATQLQSRTQNVRGLVERPDGNNVSEDRESMQMAQAQLEFRTATALLKREFTRIHEAMEDGK